MEFFPNQQTGRIFFIANLWAVSIKQSHSTQQTLQNTRINWNDLRLTAKFCANFVQIFSSPNHAEPYFFFGWMCFLALFTVFPSIEMDASWLSLRFLWHQNLQKTVFGLVVCLEVVFDLFGHRTQPWEAQLSAWLPTRHIGDPHALFQTGMACFLSEGGDPTRGPVKMVSNSTPQVD